MNVRSNSYFSHKFCFTFSILNSNSLGTARHTFGIQELGNCSSQFSQSQFPLQIQGHQLIRQMVHCCHDNQRAQSMWKTLSCLTPIEGIEKDQLMGLKQDMHSKIYYGFSTKHVSSLVFRHIIEWVAAIFLFQLTNHQLTAFPKLLFQIPDAF